VWRDAQYAAHAAHAVDPWVLDVSVAQPTLLTQDPLSGRRRSLAWRLGM